MITFLSVTKKFGSGDVALQDISFHIRPSEFVIITGPSGSGKTTMMNLLIKDLVPTEGEITYKGDSLDEITKSGVPLHRRKIGVVFQDYRLLPELNVWENIALPLSIIGKSNSEIESRVTDLLSLVGLTEKAMMFPKQLSGGEAQRVSIARALATGPGLIFADEPTGNLDKESSLEIVKLLKQINDLGTTVLFATHDVAVLEALEKERHLELIKGVLKNDSNPSKIEKVEKDKSKEKESKEEKKTDDSMKSESDKKIYKSEKKGKKSKDSKESVTKPKKEKSSKKELAKQQGEEGEFQRKRSQPGVDKDLLDDFTSEKETDKNKKSEEDLVFEEKGQESTKKKKSRFSLPFFKKKSEKKQEEVTKEKTEKK
ncbi:MAG: ATP-binding cassette domain-containing protein [Candidatus Pacebacteria bacterium]|jgi:cell division transport system ATP-binding protein|nr:ATP-binding cassette domain-containing protein [Candidatus Paceibacterota bacterium]MBT4652322.1 ATP-binding cassette domain-containing protein [Candidatus Paceibacterota bacterium]MBT6756149.1 ATP-binding cassette domain-containing protein [Candidatus Paceibacterota bacterium]MBT6921746.1 ATP-binding cassette domain-containing protein [Candidatus Paceibacterota bacterium]